MGHSGKKGFTLVELVITVTILAILAASTAGIIISLMQMVVYLPREVKVRMVAQEAMDAMIEGDSNVAGLRCSDKIISADGNNVTYEIGYPKKAEKRDVQLSWDDATRRLRRRYTALGQAGTGSYGAWEDIPYYATSEISITGMGVSVPIFSYYNADGTVWAPQGTPPMNLSDIRRVDIGIVVTTGTGLFQNWEGSFSAAAGVDIKQYTT